MARRAALLLAVGICLAIASLSVAAVVSPAAGGLQQALMCNCDPSAPTDPVCDPGTLSPVGRTGCEAHCKGHRSFVRCSTLRTLDFNGREVCMCRNEFDPICAGGNSTNNLIGLNPTCSECLGTLPADNEYEKCPNVEPWNEPIFVDLSCQCTRENMGAGDNEAVCSTIDGRRLASSACQARCMGFLSFVPCSRLANNQAMHPVTGSDELPLSVRNCTTIGARLGDVAATIACQQLAKTCPRGRIAGGYLENASFERFTVMPTCYSSATTECYNVATEEALKDGICSVFMSRRTKNCTAKSARELFGKIVSHVCAETMRDGSHLKLFGTQEEEEEERARVDENREVRVVAGDGN